MTASEEEFGSKEVRQWMKEEEQAQDDEKSNDGMIDQTTPDMNHSKMKPQAKVGSSGKYKGGCVNGTELDELHRVNASELGKFVIQKMSTETLDRLWKRSDEDNSGHISRGEVRNTLQWMSVYYVDFSFRQQGGQCQLQINKRKLKAQFVPVTDWILENKMNTKKVVHRPEFRKVFGAWLEEYGELNGYDQRTADIKALSEKMKHLKMKPQPKVGYSGKCKGGCGFNGTHERNGYCSQCKICGCKSSQYCSKCTTQMAD